MPKTSSCVYNINYHIVWCPKYRKPILKGKIKEFIEEQIYTISGAKDYEVIDLKVMPDHIHLFLSAKPSESPTSIVKVLKGVSALRAFKRFPELKNIYRRGKMWSPSYYVGTAGKVSADTIRRYIDEQGRNSSTD
ncbi:MAG: IS200/IS605 family transposase [Thermoproteota archaeon]|nr:MAG: IS200/IS605 family transposase [Candidatus Korarchaeota archaeon]